ncbi:MAG: DUF6338 family protein [Terracidiphilus sp.]
MLPDKPDALGVLLVLLPGFACAYAVQILAARRKQTELDKVVEALLFSLLIYLVTLPILHGFLPLRWVPEPGQQPNSYQIFIDYPHLLTLAAAAFLFALLYAANINHDWLMKAFRWMGITERTSRTSIWNDAFQEIGGDVQVGIADGRCIVGWVRDYSDEDGEQTLFLENAAWLLSNRDGSETEMPIDDPGILLTKEMKIEYVVFLPRRQP